MPSEGSRNTLLVAAAADLAASEQPLDTAFAQATGAHFRFVLGASGMLARQIERGAPYDVFLSADQRYVRELADAGKLQPDTVRVYAVGRLGLWSRDRRIRELQELAGPGVRAVGMANPAHAPYGLAARQAFDRLGIWPKVEPKVVYGENVRQALQFAQSGNADAAVTAWSLVKGNGGVLVPAELHAPIRQSAGIVAASAKPELARRFLDFLASPAGRQVLETQGFSPGP